MGLRHWLRQRLGSDEAGDDVPPGRAILGALWGGDEERLHALGEYTAATYPPELAERLARRERVARELIEVDIADRESRVAAIPRLRELLRIYPHPLVYETLIHAYLDAGRVDEARGVAFAARERRKECARSEFPEIRAEIEHLRDWSNDEIERLAEARR